MAVKSLKTIEEATTFNLTLLRSFDRIRCVTDFSPRLILSCLGLQDVGDLVFGIRQRGMM